MTTNIAIVGAGTMGKGIAIAFARFGYDVNLFDVDAVQLSKVKDHILPEVELMAREGLIEEVEVQPLLDRIILCEELERAVADADYVIECAPEKLEIKQKLFADLDRLCKASAIFASNTSSLQLEDIMLGLSDERKAQTMVNHWYNPAHLMPIAELSFFGNTSEAVFDQVETLYVSIGKQTVKVLKDVPGLVANRIQQAVAREVFDLIQQEVASAEDIDRALKFGPAFRYATTGQLEIADFGGLDIWTAVGDNLLPKMSAIQMANPMLAEKVNQGHLGFKTGKGFFEYPEDEQDRIKQAFYAKLIHQLKASEKY